jgi:7,8-dihydropterin-6-yl-methyl-4-(beta-D-ribofuranosyl)aminobenzene 5'-phosphate synthase
MASSVKISILMENQAGKSSVDKIFVAQHGLSLFVEAKKRILFDAGASGMFMHNADLLGIDLQSADVIILSHGHWDHADGLQSLLPAGMKKQLVAHPQIFVDRHRQTGEYNGVGFTEQEAAERFELILTKDPYHLDDHIYFLGEIPRVNDFEAKQTTFYYLDGSDKRPDFVMDDSALAIRTHKGLVIVSGCSHAGICNIIEYAKKVCAENRVNTVLGGFHLLDDSEQLERTIAYFLKNPVDQLYPMHCTGIPALSRFHKEFGVKKLGAGDIIVID